MRKCRSGRGRSGIYRNALPCRRTSRGSNLGGNAGLQTQTVLSLDWRFLPTWLLRGTAAVGGSQPSGGLDVLWQYRY